MDIIGPRLKTDIDAAAVIVEIVASVEVLEDIVKQLTGREQGTRGKRSTTYESTNTCASLVISCTLAVAGRGAAFGDSSRIH